MIEQDPAPQLARLGAQIVELSAGRHDARAGAYLDLEELAASDPHSWAR
jgi:hypothetical protein